MKQPNGYSTHAPKSSAAKQWIKELAQTKEVIVFSQPCYDRGRAQMYSKALTRELSTFANVREEIRQF